MKTFKTLILIVSLFGPLLLAEGCQGQNTTIIDTAQQTTDSSKAELPDTILVTAVGDIMLGSGFPSTRNLPPDDAKNSFKHAAGFLRGDIIFGNLEGCFLDTGNSKKCEGLNPNSCYAFRMPNRYAQVFKSAGFNLLSMANNHAGDFEYTGRRNTARLLDSVDIKYAGQMNKPYTIFQRNGVKYGFIAFAPNENTVPLNDLANAIKLCQDVKEQVNVLIVSFHGGGEGAKFEHVTRQPELFYKENRGNVYDFAHTVIDAGADLVLGHGPHVTRAVEVYKNRFIAYSLGNFCTYGMFNLSGPNGIAPLLQIKLASNGQFLSANVISFKQDKIKRLHLDDTHAAYRKIKQLTQIDFPDNQLRFIDNQILPQP